MAITVLHIFSGDLWAGAEVLIGHLLGRLAAEPEVRIIALALNEGVLTGKLRESGIEVLAIPESSTSFPSIVRAAFASLRARKIDVIHTHRYKENALGWCLGKLLDVKHLVATIHGLPEPRLPDRPARRGVSWSAKANLWLLRNSFEKIVAVSEEMKGVLSSRYRLPANHVEVIYNGIRVPAVREDVDRGGERPFRIGTVGRFVPVKDHVLFLKTAAFVAQRRPHVRFSLLGDGPLQEALRRQAVDLGIGPGVEFCSPVSDAFPFYRSLDLYLCTSLHEGIPLSILEAMSCEKAVVAPGVGGIPEIIADEAQGLLVPSRLPEDFGEACLRLAGDPERRRAMGRAARARVHSAFSDTIMAAHYLDLYRGLLARESV